MWKNSTASSESAHPYEQYRSDWLTLCGLPMFVVVKAALLMLGQQIFCLVKVYMGLFECSLS